jgi:polyvinyl alcohol dehydrogenase (cytochrome)
MLRASFLVTSAVALLSVSVLAQNPRFVPPQMIPQDPNDWPMYNRDVIGSRFNPAEATLTPKSVKHLKIEWVFPTAGDVYATPSVVNNIVYAGDTSGSFYAITSAGTLLWKTSGSGSIKFGPITASALVTNNAHEVEGIDRPDRGGGMVIFGDHAGVIYGLDRNSGQVIWSVRPNPNHDAAIFGTPILANGQVIIGISSNEGSTKTTFRGSVVSLDPNNNGSINWQTLITPLEQNRGSSGAGIWSSPTYDPATDTVYVTTGNNYTSPATATSDAFVALKGRDGKIIWTHQCVSNDTGTVEADIGDSPQIYTLPSGEKVVGAGEKNGIYWVLDAISGELVGSIKAVLGCVPGEEGLFADSATANGVVFVNGQDCSVFAKPPFIPPTGVVIALKNKTDSSGNLKMEELWRFESPFAPVLSGVAVANGVVYFHNSGILSVLYALDAATGRVLAKVFTNGGISGPSVSNGQIYVGTGTLFASGVATPTGIVAIGESGEQRNREWR